MTEFTITKPDDMHLHLRDGEILQAVAPHTAAQFGRAIIMPNLVPPVTNTKLAAEYRERILAATENFKPLMTLYLTDNTSAQDITDAANSSFVHGAKLYPAGATTNSDSGVTDVKNIYPVLEEMEKQNFPLLIHGEVTAHEIDVFEREKEFIDNILTQVVSDFPNLRIVFEHITTMHAAEFVKNSGDNIVATITAHHLLFNRNDMLVGGIKPHYYCLPILKAEDHRKALVAAAVSGSKKFFAGTDSAPHIQGNKESDCGCAGCYTASTAIELYAQVFDIADLAKAETQNIFENFMSKNGADFYGLEYNSEKVTIKRESKIVPEKVTTSEGDIIPLLAGKELSWNAA